MNDTCSQANQHIGTDHSFKAGAKPPGSRMSLLESRWGEPGVAVLAGRFNVDRLCSRCQLYDEMTMMLKGVGDKQEATSAKPNRDRDVSLSRASFPDCSAIDWCVLATIVQFRWQPIFCQLHRFLSPPIIILHQNWDHTRLSTSDSRASRSTFSWFILSFLTSHQ